MHIGILIHANPKKFKPGAGVQRLIEAGETLGHTVVPYFEALFVFSRTDAGLTVTYDGKPVEVDIFYNRVSSTHEPSLHTVTTELLKDLGYNIVNHQPSASVSMNKLGQHQVLSAANIPMPNWSIVRSSDQLNGAMKAISFPAILKVAFGCMGKGVFYAENEKTLRPIVDYLLIRDKNPVILEEYIKEANQSCVRAFVIGNEVAGSMIKEAPANEIRANIHGVGGNGIATNLSEEEREIVINATKVFNLDVAGVDFVRSARGPLILEVNANPGFDGLEAATKIDIASALIHFFAKR